MYNYKYFTKESKVNAYIPITLIKGNLGNTTLIVYGVLLSRTTLSQKNNWADEFGRIYIIYPIKKISEDVGKSESVVKTSLRRLKRLDS